MPNNKIFAFVGTTGVGKTYYSKYLIDKYGFVHIHSTTTRPPREKNSDEYNHLSVNEFIELIERGEMLEYTKFNGHYYGKRKSDFSTSEDKHHVITMTPDRIAEVKSQLPNTVFIHLTLENPVVENTVRRISDRNLSDKEIADRIETIKTDLKYLDSAQKAGLIDHKVITVEGNKNVTYGLLDEIIHAYL